MIKLLEKLLKRQISKIITVILSVFIKLNCWNCGCGYVRMKDNYYNLNRRNAILRQVLMIFID